MLIESNAPRTSGNDAIEDSERVKLALAAGAILGTWNWDIQTDRFTVDEAFAHNFGLDPALGRSGISLEQVTATVHPDDQAGLAAAIAAAVERGGRYVHQYRVRRGDGEYYWLEANGHVEHGADGTPLRFPGVLTDLEGRRALIAERDRALATLRESEAHWRGLFAKLNEGMVIGELIRDGDGAVTDWRYVDVNAAWGELIGIDPSDTVGKTVRELVPEVERIWIDRCADVVRTGKAAQFIERVGAFDRWYDCHCFALEEERFGMLFVDASERIKADSRRTALLELGDRLRETEDIAQLGQAAAEIMARVSHATRAGYGVCDSKAETVDILSDWCAPGTASVMGLHSFRTFGSYVDDLKRGEIVVIEDIVTDPRTADSADALLELDIRSLLNIPIIERGDLVGIAVVHHDIRHAYDADEMALIRTVADRVQVTIARLRAEERQDILNRELSHRMKNMLAMVLSIATQTLKAVPDQEPVDAFEKRIHALSSAHDVLLRSNWETAGLEEVARGVLTTFAPDERIAMSGPSVSLGSRATLSTTLLLHEMATNAAKHGALANDAGRIDLAWRILGEGENAELVIDWIERDGPPVVQPERRGFGSRLMRMGLVGTGGVEIDYKRTGIEAQMRAGFDHIGQA